jgi:hypothetical protein
LHHVIFQLYQISGDRLYNKRFETDSPIVTVLASAAPARTRANYGSRLKSVVMWTFGIGNSIVDTKLDRLVPF